MEGRALGFSFTGALFLSRDLNFFFNYVQEEECNVIVLISQQCQDSMLISRVHSHASIVTTDQGVWESFFVSIVGFYIPDLSVMLDHYSEVTGFRQY